MTYGMTVLAQERHPLYQHPWLRAAVRVVANRTVLFDRLVLPQKRPAHLRMALVAGLVDRILDQVAPGTPMRVVAARTQDLTFLDGMS